MHTRERRDLRPPHSPVRISCAINVLVDVSDILEFTILRALAADRTLDLLATTRRETMTCRAWLLLLLVAHCLR